jgi:hypothetical protein
MPSISKTWYPTNKSPIRCVDCDLLCSTGTARIWRAKGGRNAWKGAHRDKDACPFFNRSLDLTCTCCGFTGQQTKPRETWETDPETLCPACSETLHPPEPFDDQDPLGLGY